MLPSMQDPLPWKKCNDSEVYRRLIHHETLSDACGDNMAYYNLSCVMLYYYCKSHCYMMMPAHFAFRMNREKMSLKKVVSKSGVLPAED